ncbi:arylamine N-acetyltransferase [Dactylosporangium fulvum]|uniref:Arylamine N-acetyltransferase n=1 Tax=Dactylosporangium fulvum TaxID=53359 RepID=A0ABY5WBI6_9ACTN|nr:arylamine N-acetyltransferase [Dactylosporangium fulvum]UWP87227.1 arylamine N-acetyltransferase [Dactylosporangium fulvum]
MDDTRADAYLERIGVDRPARPDLDALRRLQRAHLGAVPFENLSIHLGEPVVLEEAALLDKIVDRRRGGFCYELNGAFGALLRALGYRVTLHSARVWGGGRFSAPFDHLALRVELDAPWLVDVGFGRFCHHPLRLDARGPQSDPGGVFEVVEHPGAAGPPDLDVRGESGWEYRLDQRPYDLSDFVPTCWWHQTSPASHFPRSLTCSRLTASGGRVTLSGTTLITTDGETRSERVLSTEEALSAYDSEFGIVLDRLPVVDR